MQKKSFPYSRHFGVLALLLLILFSAFNLANSRYMRKIDEAVNEKMFTSVDNSSSLNELTRNYSLISIHLSDMVYQPGADFATQKAEVLRLSALNDQLIKEMQENTLGIDDQSALTKLQESRSRYHQQRQRVFDLVEDGRHEQAAVVWRTEAQSSIRSYEAQQLELSQLLHRHALQSAATINTTMAKVTQLNRISTWFFIILLGVMVSVLVIWAIHFVKAMRAYTSDNDYSW